MSSNFNKTFTSNASQFMTWLMIQFLMQYKNGIKFSGHEQCHPSNYTLSFKSNERFHKVIHNLGKKTQKTAFFVMALKTIRCSITPETVIWHLFWLVFHWVPPKYCPFCNNILAEVQSEVSHLLRFLMQSKNSQKLSQETDFPDHS